MSGDHSTAGTEDKSLLVKQLSVTVESLRVAFNRNHKAYAEAISSMDGHIAVLRAVINDIHLKSALVDAQGNIDWDTYYGMYNEYLKNQAEAESKPAEAAETSALVTAQSVDEVTFGGDYGGGNRSVPEGS